MPARSNDSNDDTNNMRVIKHLKVIATNKLKRGDKQDKKTNHGNGACALFHVSKQSILDNILVLVTMDTILMTMNDDE